MKLRALPVVPALLLVVAGTVSAQRLPDLELRTDATTRLLVLAPHPDDEAIGAAGLIRRVVTTGGTVRIVLLTSGDGFSEAVETVEGIKDPKPSDFRNYGRLRERETLAAMRTLGVDSRQVTFLGFPDQGMCLLATTYLSAKRRYESPYTDRISPPLTEQVIRGVRYRGIDVRRELARVISEFGPNLVVMPHQGDDHPDHCATHIFAKEALAESRVNGRLLQARILYYLVHDGQWPLSPDAVEGSTLQPPSDFPASEGRWTALRLTEHEIDAKKLALLSYVSQMRAIGRFLLAFGRADELFVDTEPTTKPECWCDDHNVATEKPPSRVKPRPKRKP